MGIFATSYNTYIKPIEGGYANVTNDKGGETYAGITRKNFPSWVGWSVIDAKPHPIKHNAKFSELDTAVSDFYLGLYNQNNFNKITNQNVADILFDWFVNSGYLAVNTKEPETYGVDEILNKYFGKNLPMDGKFDAATIAAINSVDPVKLYNQIKKERETFYRTRVAKDATQQKFLNGWLNRLAKFPNIQAIVTLSGMFLFVALVFFLYLFTKS